MPKAKKARLSSVNGVGKPVVEEGDRKGKGRSVSGTADLPPTISIANFLAVPLRLPGGASSSSQPKQAAYHWLYVRPHQSSHSEQASSSSSSSSRLPADRTLFVANLPVDTTERHLKSLFQNAGVPGHVQRVDFSALKKAAGGSAISAVELLGRARRIAAGEAEEDDLDDEDSAGNDGMQTLSVDQQQQWTAKQGKGKRKGQEKDSDKRAANSIDEALAAIPSVTPLPSMEPREAAGAQPLLPTSTAAHVVFLDPSSLQAALEAAKNGSLTTAGWINPYQELEEAAAARAAAEADADRENLELDSDARGKGKRKGATTTATGMLLSSGITAPPLGLSYLLQSHRLARPSLEAVRAYSDSTIARYEYLRNNPAAKAKLEEAEAALQGKSKPSAKKGIQGVSIGPDGEMLDEDGFVIVQRGGKFGRANAGAGQGVGVIRKNAPGGEEDTEASLQRKKKKHKGIELEDFYKFQRREKKRDELADMRAQFEKDKERVRKLKEGRKFKP